MWAYIEYFMESQLLDYFPNPDMDRTMQKIKFFFIKILVGTKNLTSKNLHCVYITRGKNMSSII